MRKLQQTRIHNPPEILGNCFPTVIACFLDLNSPEDVIQIQEKYKEDDWNVQLQDWLKERGWVWRTIDGHLYDGSFYTVTGKTDRGASHICIYQNGELYHDPNPCNEGLLTEDFFEVIEEIKKVCFKCGENQVLSQYYKHPQMGDGRLNKCKTCTKKDVKQQTEINTSTPEGLEKERQRHRDKYRRLGYKDLQKEWDKDKPWKATTVYKGLRRNYYKDLSKEYELHHWNYSDDFLKDVFILNIKDHKELHNSLFLDLEKRIFYLEDGTYLDTKEKHADYITRLGIKIIKQ
jgi:hypothetical protein